MLQNATIADHNLWWRDEEQMGAWSWSYFIFTFFSLIQLLLVLFLLLQQKTGEPVTSQTTGYIEYVRAGKKWESDTNGWTTLQTSIRVSRWQSMLNHEIMINDLIIVWYAHRISRFKLKLKATMLYLPCGK